MSKNLAWPQFNSTILTSKHLSYLLTLALALSRYGFLILPRRWMDFQKLLSRETLNRQGCPAGAWSSAVSFSHSSRFCCQSHRICPVKKVGKGAKCQGGGGDGVIASSREKIELYLIEEHQQIQAHWSVSGLAFVWPEAEFICRGIVSDCTVGFKFTLHGQLVQFQKKIHSKAERLSLFLGTRWLANKVEVGNTHHRHESSHVGRIWKETVLRKWTFCIVFWVTSNIKQVQCNNLKY